LKRDAEARMSFFEHLEELRQRLLRSVLAIVVGFSVCMYFREPLFLVASAPLRKLLPENTSLVFTGLPDPFFMYLKVSFVAGLLLTIPYILYQLWLFVTPGLYQKERRLAVPFVLVAAGLFYTGALFAYFLVFPVVFNFFLGFQSPELRPVLSVKEYVSLILKLMVAFGVVFETPIVLVFLGLLGIVNSDMLKKGRRYFVVAAFVVGAIFSPPDVVSQIMMGLPLLVLFEASIHVLAFMERRRKAEEQQEEEVAGSE
jgi:sec-independent protein translocase protein TatC